MEALYIMIPLTLLLSGTALAGCIWAIKRGQFDDVETPPLRMLDDLEMSLDKMSLDQINIDIKKEKSKS